MDEEAKERRRRPTSLDSLQKSDHPTLVAQCHVFLRSVRRNSGKIADKNSREEKVYNMSPADRSQCHRQPHHHPEVRDYPDTPLRFQIFIFKMFVIFIYICTILVQTFIKCWNLEFLDFPDVPVLVIPATFELRAKKDESPEVPGLEEEDSQRGP